MLKIFTNILIFSVIFTVHGNSKDNRSATDEYIFPELVKIQNGTFLMGSNDYWDNEKPPHIVNIENQFYIGKFEVTFKEYDKFCEDTGKLKPHDNGWGRGNKPVINISWRDAKDYTIWLSNKTNKPFRLLTEAEWEYAARAHTKTKYSFGEDDNDLIHYAWFEKNSKDYGTQDVGQKKPNNFGIYDMHGNVYEYCEDWYADNYFKTPTNGSAYNKQTKYKVIRGGSWNFGKDRQRSSHRGRAYLNYREHDLGFRLAMDNR